MRNYDVLGIFDYLGGIQALHLAIGGMLTYNLFHETGAMEHSKSDKLTEEK